SRLIIASETEMTEPNNEDRLAEATSALEILLQQDLSKCRRLNDARHAVKLAGVEQKREELLMHLQTWAECIAPVIEDYYEKYVSLAAANLSTEDPIEWAEHRLRSLLEPWLGHRLEPKEPGTSLGGESFAEWLTGHEKPNKHVVWWVAEV